MATTLFTFYYNENIFVNYHSLLLCYSSKCQCTKKRQMLFEIMQKVLC